MIRISETLHTAGGAQQVVVERVSGNHKSPGADDTDCETLRQNFSDDTHTISLDPIFGKSHAANVTSLGLSRTRNCL